MPMFEESVFQPVLSQWKRSHDAEWDTLYVSEPLLSIVMYDAQKTMLTVSKEGIVLTIGGETTRYCLRGWGLAIGRCKLYINNPRISAAMVNLLEILRTNHQH